MKIIKKIKTGMNEEEDRAMLRGEEDWIETWLWVGFGEERRELS